MNAPAALPSVADKPFAAASAATAPARALIDAQMAVLSRLTEIGMEIAEACGREVRAAADTDGARTAACEIGPVFARVARAVRMTIALQSRLAKDLAALDRTDDLIARARKDERRMRLARLAAQAARDALTGQARAVADPFGDDEGALEDEIEQLADAAYERLVDVEDGELDGLSFDEAVARICKDLGLSPQWSARLRSAAEPPPPPPPVILGPAAGRNRGSRGATPDEPLLESGESWVSGSAPPQHAPRAPPEDGG